MIQRSESCEVSKLDSQKRILVIEKNPRIRNLILESFPRDKFELWAAGDGNLGLAIALAKKPDLILTDIILPERSGFLVIEYLRHHTELECPIVVLTSNTGKRHREYAELLGVERYFFKPVRVPELVQTCIELLEIKDSAARIEQPTLVAQVAG